MRTYREQSKSLRIIAATFALAFAGNALTQMPPTDEEIAEAVAAELRFSDVVEYRQMRIQVEDGIVSIVGNVPSITASRQIEDVTATVRGVRSIINGLEVEPGPMSPAVVSENVIAALNHNPATDLYQLDVTVNDGGTLVLTGTVESWAEVELAELVAGSVRGVRAIDNRIQVDAARTYRGEEEIHDDISERLRWDARVDESLISILVRDGGRVTLSGTVGSLAEKRLATMLALVAGVSDVDASHLEVEAWARDANRSLGADSNVGDDEISTAVAVALSLDPRVPAESVDIEVTDGEVWLRGEVSSVMASRAAESVATNTRGSRNVHNLIEIAPVALDNAEVVREIMDAIFASTLDLQDRIVVSVDRGLARIDGDVDTVEQYRHIDEIVANTRGVRDLDNQLTIRGEHPRIAAEPFLRSPQVMLPGHWSGRSLPSDRELFSAVESEFFWSPFVDGDDINIQVDAGAVTLSGEVDSINESRSAVNNAFEAGATIVNNNLEVE